MLDPNALKQLSQLKQTIRADKNLAQGVIRGSQGRFGFITLDDGREAFLPPETMARVLPGDRVEVSIEEGDANGNSGKLAVDLDKLINSNTHTLVGKYIIRGKGHFIAVDMPQLNRWLFIPPKARGKAEEGDFLVCQLLRHPFEDGKGQAKVKEVLGKPSTPHIEHQVICRKYALPQYRPTGVQNEADKISKLLPEQIKDSEKRSRLESLPFITIDSATTKDMDDALHIEKNTSGWRLSVAIANPTAAIPPQSQLDKDALLRGNTAYLPGNSITMLPEELSHQTFSLVPGKVRPALLCQLDIEPDGEISNYQFEFCFIQSAHKFSYEQVADFLENQNSAACPEESHSMLRELAECSHALKQSRREHMLLMDEQDDYELILDDNGHIRDILRQPHNLAQQLVEESMLAVNRSAGKLLAEHPGSGLFSTHGGFRPEKIQEIASVLESDHPEIAKLDPSTLEGYRQLIQALQNKPEASSLLAAFRQMLQAGALSLEARPHLGLGMEHYATVTSPIRRYNDLHNHRAIEAILNGTTVTPPSGEELARLQKSIITARSASRDLEQWLICQFMEQHTDKPLTAYISRVTSQGVTVKLDDWGVTGFVKLDPKAFKFDDKRLILTGDEISYKLDQPVQVVLDRVDLDKKRINFRWVD